MYRENEYYYRILGLHPGATSSEIKSSYRQLVKLYHPDRDRSPDGAIMYREIREAYDVLLNPKTSGGTGTDFRSDYSRSHNNDFSGDAKWTSEEWAEYYNIVDNKKDFRPFGFSDDFIIFTLILSAFAIVFFLRKLF